MKTRLSLCLLECQHSGDVEIVFKSIVNQFSYLFIAREGGLRPAGHPVWRPSVAGQLQAEIPHHQIARRFRKSNWFSVGRNSFRDG